MATIGTAIRLNDMMSAPIQNITNAMNMMLSAWESLDYATSGGLDINGVEAIRSELNQATRALDQLGDEQEEFNREVREGATAMDGLTDHIMGAVGAYAGLQGLQQLTNLSDTFTQTQARLAMIVDEGSNAEELFDRIAASADRARAPIQDMADTVAKLSLNAGDAFNSNNETILFAENLNKLFAIAGTEQASIASASLQLTQALGSGVLRGEEFNAVFEAAPNIMQTVADYMDVPIGKLRSMAAEGQITAEIVKNALLGATEEINTQFESMPMTWAQVWTSVMNGLYYASIPLLNFVNLLANNWSVIAPLILGVTAALAVYLAATKGVELATKAWAAAQALLNGVMALNPVYLIIMGVILLISVLYAVVAAINKIQGTTISATGIIMGVLAVAGAFVVNLFIGVINAVIEMIWAAATPILSVIEWVLNAINGGFNSFGDACANLIGQIIGWFLNLGKVVTTIIDAIFGTNWTGGLESLRNSVTAWGKNEQVITLTGDAPTINRLEYGNAWDTGYDFGAGLDDSMGEFFTGGYSGLGDKYSLDDLTSSIGSVPAIDDIATNTGGIKDSLDVTSENLKYMKDIAEQDVINRFTTAEIRVEMGGVNNTVNHNTDLDGMMDYMVTGVQEAMEKAAEGVHD